MRKGGSKRSEVFARLAEKSERGSFWGEGASSSDGRKDFCVVGNVVAFGSELGLGGGN